VLKCVPFRNALESRRRDAGVALAPVAFASLAALCWGVADYTVARLGADMRALTTFACVQLGGFGALLVLGAALGVELPPRDRLLVILGIGAVGTFAYLLLYTALQMGPVSVASPVAATNGAIAAVFGVVFLHEPLGSGGVLGLVLVSAGVVSASAEPNAIQRAFRGRRPVLPGAVLALAAAVLIGLTLFLFDSVVGSVSLVTLLLIIRAVGAVTAVPILGALDAPPRRPALVAVAVGVLDAAGFVAFVLGLRVGRVAVVSPISSLFAVVTVILAWALLQEPLSTVQKVGIGLVIAGVPLLSGV
jgi:drug/metabolite transporter (DMT)-like permease